VTFFLYAADDAGVQVSGRVLKGRKPRATAPRRKSARPEPAHPQEIEAGPAQPQPATSYVEVKKPSEVLLMYLDPNDMDDEQQAAVWTMLKYFKSKGL
jgi:hypothetical protein